MSDVEMTWQDKLVAERKRIGRELTVAEMIALARPNRMTAAEIEAQRQSWQRQDKD